MKHSPLLKKCNCVVRHGGAERLPAIRKGNAFYDPSGLRIATPDSYEDMEWEKIAALLDAHGEVCIAFDGT